MVASAQPIDAYERCKRAHSAPEKIEYCSIVVYQSRDPKVLLRAHNTRGLAYLEVNRFAEAAQDFTYVISINPTIAGYYDNRQNAWRMMGRLSDALNDANTAVRLAPTYSFVYRGRALVYDAMGQTDLAIKDFNAAVSIEPGDVGLLTERGKLFAKSGHVPEAIRDFSSALNIDPKATGAMRERGLAFKQIGDWDAALADLLLFARLEPNDQEVNQAIQDIRTRSGSAKREEIPLRKKDSDRPQPEQQNGASSGTGFFISKDGYLVTNAHVVEGCRSVQVTSGQSAVTPARIVARDSANDLALLQSALKPAADVASLRPGVRIGENIAVFGFPLVGLLTTGGNFTVGNVSAVAGLGDDTRYIQISAPVQPGNSGGPVLDERGNVVGVVVGKLDAIKVASVVNDVAQNVNFAIKTSILMNFLDANSISYSYPNGDSTLPPADIAERAKSISLLVECDK